MRIEPRANYSKIDAAAGFTLLEVIVAFAIAALALVGLVQAGSGGLFAVDTASRVNRAVERAQSHLAAFGRSGIVTAGVATGIDPDGYRWELRAEPIAGGGSPIALYDVRVTISWRNGRRDRSVMLETRRIGPAPASE